MAGKVTKHAGGRPTVMTNDVLLKLEQAFALGASDEEACFYAGITKTPFYEYQTEHPEFKERKEALKEKPILQARETLVKSLKYNPEMALKYLKAKRKTEFSEKHELELSGLVTVEATLSVEEKEKLKSLIKRK